MSEYRDSLLELLDSLSLAQVSIEQTSSFILSHPEELGQALEVWSEYLNRKNDDKLICLLYLANDLLQKIVEKEDRLNFGNIIMSNHKYFSSDQVRSVLIRLIKIWTERHLLSSEMLAKFQTLMDHLKTQQPVKYTVENLLSFLTVFEQTNNFIRNNIIQEHGEKCNAASMQSENANHENIRKWKEQKMQCVAVVGDIKNEIFHCRVQKSEFAALKQNFKNITEKVQKMITNYSDYRDRIIQLRWRIENVKQQLLKVRSNKDIENNMSKETHEITDMDIEKSDDREQLPKSETKKESHYAVTNPTFLFPNMMFLHPPIQHPMYPPPELISPYPENFTNNTFQNIPPITNVIDYNHGFGQILYSCQTPPDCSVPPYQPGTMPQFFPPASAFQQPMFYVDPGISPHDPSKGRQ